MTKKQLPQEIKNYFNEHYPQYAILCVDEDGKGTYLLKSQGELSQVAALLAMIDDSRDELLDLLSVDQSREVIEMVLKTTRDYLKGAE